MDTKLEEYRARKRRQAAVDTIKSKLFSMIPFQTQPTDQHHVIVEEETKPTNSDADKPSAKPAKKPPPDESSSSDDEPDTVLPFTDSDEDAAANVAAKKPPAPPTDYLTYLTWIAYFLLWATCWAIAIELQFGIVYLLISGIAGIYLNTRTGPRSSKREVSAYSVFNRNCHAIDGTLNAEQFEREIRYGPGGVR